MGWVGIGFSVWGDYTYEHRFAVLIRENIKDNKKYTHEKYKLKRVEDLCLQQPNINMFTLWHDDASNMEAW